MALLFGAGWVIPLEGPWVDFAISKFLSYETRLPVYCEKTKIFHWSQASFETMAVRNQKRHPILIAGPGNIYFIRSPFRSIDLRNLRLGESFHLADFFSSSPIGKGLEGKFSVIHLKAGLLGNSADGLIRVFHCASNDFSLRGGLVLKARQVIKAHFYFSLAPSRLKKLPSQIRYRMIGAGGGWMAVHVVYYQNRLTFTGRNGPLFQARWQGKGASVLG